MEGKLIWRRVGVGVAVLALVAGVALAGDLFIWTGASDPGDNLYTNEDNWNSNSSGYPGEPYSMDDDAIIDDPLLRSTCVLDTSGGIRWISDLLLEGDSPTKMTLDIEFAELEVVTFTWKHFGRLVVDAERFTAGLSILSGSVFATVDAGETCDLGTVWVNSSNTRMDITGLVETQSLHIDANDSTYGGDTRALTTGGGTLCVDPTLYVKGTWDTGVHSTLYRGKLWMRSGTLTARLMELQGADGDAAGRVDLDIDEDVTIAVKTTLTNEGDFGGGNVVIDVADGKVLDTGEFVLNGPCKVTVTSGVTVNPGKLVSSDPDTWNGCS